MASWARSCVLAFAAWWLLAAGAGGARIRSWPELFGVAAKGAASARAAGRSLGPSAVDAGGVIMAGVELLWNCSKGCSLRTSTVSARPEDGRHLLFASHGEG